MLASAPSNENFVLYSTDSHELVNVYRDKYREKDQVYEDYVDVDFRKFPI